MSPNIAPVDESAPGEVAGRVRRHVHADDVLPPGLVAALQLHVDAVYVWVPSKLITRANDRARRVVELRGAGWRPTEIGAELGITERRVYQLLKRAGLTGAATTK